MLLVAAAMAVVVDAAARLTAVPTYHPRFRDADATIDFVISLLYMLYHQKRH